MELNLYNSKGKKLTKKVKLDESVFKAKVNEYLMGLAVYVYLSNQRKSTAHTKTRAEVRGGGKKPWAQKGTGRARHGSIRSPIWKGGGVAFGPRNEKNYKKKLSKKMKKAAIRSVFADFAERKRIIILENIDFKDGKLTKQMIELTEKLPVKDKVLYLQNGKMKRLFLGSRNLKKINVISVNEVNVYTLLKCSYLVIQQEVLEDISKFWGREITRKVKKEKIKQVKVSDQKKVSKAKDSKGVKGEGIENLDLSKRVVSALIRQKINTKKQLVDSIKSGKKIKGIGEKSLNEIKKILKIS